MSANITTIQEEGLESTFGNVPAIIVSDKDDTKSTASSFGSFADFKSQAELYPSSLIQEKGYLANNGDVEENKKCKKVAKEYTGIKRYGGMLLTIAASICFSFVMLMVKFLSDYGTDAYGSTFWRYLGITLPTIPILMFYGCGSGGKQTQAKGLKENAKQGSIFDPVWPIFKNDNWKTWIGLFSRGLIGSTSVILRYYSVQYLSIGDTSVITYSTPVLVTVMAHFCLGERCGVVPVIIAFTTLIGVIIVLRPPLITGAAEFDTNTLFGTMLACGSLFCSSLIVIITRKIREVHFALMILVFGTIGVAQSGIMAYTLGHGHLDIPTGLEYSLLTGGVAVLSFLGQMSIVLALKFEQAGPVALLRTCDIIFGFILQYFFLGAVPDEYSSIGGVIVLGGVLIVASRKWISTLPEESCGKRYFSWVLK